MPWPCRVSLDHRVPRSAWCISCLVLLFGASFVWCLCACVHKLANTRIMKRGNPEAAARAEISTFGLTHAEQMQIQKKVRETGERRRKGRRRASADAF